MRFWASTKRSVDSHDALSRLLDRNGRWIEVADTKAGAMIVFTTFLAKEILDPGFRGAAKVVRALPSDLSVATVAFSLVYLLALATVVVATLYAAVQAFRTLHPRLSRRRAQGYVFFGDLARRDFRDVSNRLRTLRERPLDEDLIEQIHTTATIALTKHQHVARGTGSLFWAIFSGALVYLLSQQLI